VDQILEKYAVHPTGLFLLNLPTGFGKTYEVLQYILRHYEDDRPIFFITNLKKNLPFDELGLMFQELDLKDAYDEHVLFIDATAIGVIQYLNSQKGEIPDEVTRWPEYRLLKRKASYVYENTKSQQQSWNDDKAEAADIIEEEIRKELEPKFRKKLIQYIDNGSGAISQYKSPKQKLSWIETNAFWIIGLYPSVQTMRKRICFMSVDKFFARNVTLIEPSYFFYEHRAIDKALVFLDEFDASKERLLNAIIRNGLDKRIDLVALFQQVYTTFQTLQLPLGLTKESKKRQEALKKNQRQKPILEIVDYLKNRSAILTSEFHLDVPFKTVNPDNRRNFIFHDFQYRSILKEGFQFIRLEYDDSEHVNHIHFEEANNMGDGVSLLRMLAQIRSYLQYFAKGVWIVAMNYRNLKEEAGAHEFPAESALRTVLDLFNLEARQVNYLMDSIVSHQSRQELDEEEGLPQSNYLREHSFYMNGFRYYDFEDGDNHDLTSRIFLCSFEVTPEKLLLKLAQKANVIGISATATIPTPTGNYDLSFLRQRLGENYRVVDSIEFENLQNQFQTLTEGYSNLHIHAELLEGEATEQALTVVFEDSKFSRELLEELLTGQNGDFFLRRYLRAALAFKHFLQHQNLKSFLYLGNAKATNQYSFQIELLHRIFDQLIKISKTTVWRDPKNRPFFLIYSQQFDQKKENLMQILGEGEKVFVISTFQSIGAGQNLQYPIPKNWEGININDRPFGGNLKDFDGIYCERPTNLIVNKTNTHGKTVLTEEELVQNIFQVEFLAEIGEISNEKALHEIRKGFKLLSGRKPTFSELDFKEQNLYSTDSYAQHISKVIIQAIGRMSRTNSKNTVIHILAHHSLSKLLRKAPDSQQIYLHEYEALLEKCQTSNYDLNEDEKRCYQLADRKNKKCQRLVESILNSEFQENNQEYWRQLRKFVMRHPRVDQLHMVPLHFQPFYFQLPNGASSYSYTNASNNAGGYTSTKESNLGICEVDCRLHDLMQHKDIRRFFEKEGYATQFGTGKFILTPVGYYSIYKGMIGETVGKYLLENYDLLELLALDAQEFEQFDFKTQNGVYIDFKHWFANSLADADHEYEKIETKRRITGARKVLIINLFGSSDFGSRKQGDTLEIPYLIEDETNKISTAMIIEAAEFIEM